MHEGRRHTGTMGARRLRDNRVVATIMVGAVVLAAAAVPAGAQRTLASPARTQLQAPKTPPISAAAFAATVARLSEPAGYFDTDNLISNESSYLHVIPRMRALGVQGGAYIGVGPDQSYSYIAAIRPRIAYLVDVRRDNLVQHLMFKALFARASSRVEFLCLWLGRRLPPDPAAWSSRAIDDIVRYVDGAPRDDALVRQTQDAIVQQAVATGVPLSAEDRATLRRFHGEFARLGLSLRFTSFGRRPRDDYPTLRDLIVARDTERQQRSYLAREEDWRFVKELHDANRIIPLVGNLAGTHTLPGIARELTTAQEKVSGFYTSNVEFYLWGDAGFAAFARNVAALPRDERSVIIRSYFARNFGDVHPLAVPGFASVQLLQPLDDFVARWRGDGWPTYRALMTLGAR
ncbi:MAG: hypothetical protein IT360_01520 [Gemmatimonadaceae bacterium]|nr:hypothetical protein [Gemmatimonadaceae bacterium]